MSCLFDKCSIELFFGSSGVFEEFPKTADRVFHMGCAFLMPIRVMQWQSW